MTDRYQSQIFKTLAGYSVRSKSEVIIANTLFKRRIPFRYEVPLRAPDGTSMVPIFTINWHGEEWYWEHEDISHDQKDHNHQEIRYDWYNRHGFDKTLILTKEGAVFNNQKVQKEINKRFTRFGIQESLGLDIH